MYDYPEEHEVRPALLFANTYDVQRMSNMMEH
jgi:hypothetical protein